MKIYISNQFIPEEKNTTFYIPNVFIISVAFLNEIFTENFKFFIFSNISLYKFKVIISLEIKTYLYFYDWDL